MDSLPFDQDDDEDGENDENCAVDDDDGDNDNDDDDNENRLLRRSQWRVRAGCLRRERVTACGHFTWPVSSSW